MTVLSPPSINQLSILEGHRLLTLAAYELEDDDTISSIYEHRLDANNDEPASPLLDANTWLTAVLPHQATEDALVFGSADGEVVFADAEDVNAVEASEHAISGLVVIDGLTVATTIGGEVLAIADGEVTSWKSEGPPLFALGHFDGVLWVAGDDGYLARREGEEWKELATGTTEPIHALARTEGGLIAIGDGGIIVQVAGDEATLRTEAVGDLDGVALWRGTVLLAAGEGGLRELTADGTKVLREGLCEAVAADSKYLVISSGSELFVSEDGATWKPLPYSFPDPSEADDHEHVHGENCDHEH